MTDNNILEVKNLKKFYPIYGSIISGKITSYVQAVNDVSFNLKKKSTLGLVGESGCGKSTIGKSILLLVKPDKGKIILDGVNIADLNPKQLIKKRKDLQIIFQDPYSSLNPRWNVEQLVQEYLNINRIGTKKERGKRVRELLDIVGISKKWINKYPHEFSGGQRQRISIARALAQMPKVLICDEPVSALDVSIQAQILNLLIELKKEFQISYLFISHDLGVVRYISDYVAVMYLGKIVETADTRTLYEKPVHPYTRALMEAAKPPPSISGKKPEKIILKGDVPDPSNPPQGCFFHTRCNYKDSSCTKEYPPMVEVEKDHFVSCFKSGQFI